MNTRDTRNSYISKLYVLLILLLSIEFVNFGGGNYSIFKLAIFPVSSIALFLCSYCEIQYPIRWSTFLLFLVCVLWFSACNLLMLDGIGTGAIYAIPFLAFVYIYMHSFNRIDYAWLFALFALPHIFSYFTGIHARETYDSLSGQRWCGLEGDPNFSAMYIVIGCIAVIRLLGRHLKIKIKVLLICYLLFILYLLFLTGSRGGMLSLGIVALLMFYSLKIPTSIKVVVTLLICFLFKLLLNYVSTLPVWVSVNDSLVDSILCRFRPDEIERGSGRSEIWTTVLTRCLNNDNILYPIGTTRAMSGLTARYAHNSLIEFVMRSGLLVGILFLLFYVLTIVRLGLNVLNHKIKEQWERDLSYIALSVNICAFFLSMIGLKIFWYFLVIAFSINQIKKYSV